MNTLISNTIENPHGIEDVCAQFTIDDITTPFTLNDVAAVGQRYTLGFWIKSEAPGSINVGGETIQTTTEFVRHVIKFTATNSALKIFFNAIGTYCVYDIKLEEGDKDTSWTPSPDDMAKGEELKNVQGTADNAQATADDAKSDVDAAKGEITQLAELISNIVTSGSESSILTQTADGGWTFNMASFTEADEKAKEEIEKLISDVAKGEKDISELQTGLNSIGLKTDYINIGTYEGNPCIELGESDSDFKLRITNKAIQFVSGTDIPAYIANTEESSKLMIEQAEIINELQQGGFAWKTRENGNLGLVWKGGN